ncbi:Hsp20/alpha crystallin family protein [Noviherbaspirillum pedocola]|uniref:Hsp20/alpha crystallin family protein n=1 Tax=Noviherbaspirillum pedocola TaxID=2801341 RepID=A0A934SP30_9BURK|nr:Hsp20/alpha crystallin family protein [Noviherbaspirillum pedocola]MBK4734101.1 Hsp20/alpha crystallin family protein [Noviherbaspirillum pedocola]
MSLILHSRAFPLLSTRTFDRGFERLVNNLVDNAPVAPRINVSETDAAYQVEADLPGVAKEDVKISVDGKRVSIEAETKRETEKPEGSKALLTERVVQKFARSIVLPQEVNSEAAVAKLENGVLTLTLPKKAEDQPKQIAIQ